MTDRGRFRYTTIKPRLDDLQASGLVRLKADLYSITLPGLLALFPDWKKMSVARKMQATETNNYPETGVLSDLRQLAAEYGQGPPGYPPEDYRRLLQVLNDPASRDSLRSFAVLGLTFANNPDVRQKFWADAENMIFEWQYGLLLERSQKGGPRRFLERVFG